MSEGENLYGAHLQRLQKQTAIALEDTGHDSLIINAGSAFAPSDHAGLPFKRTAHFGRWVAGLATPDHLLYIRPGEKPTLAYHVDRENYWSPPEDPPEELS